VETPLSPPTLSPQSGEKGENGKKPLRLRCCSKTTPGAKNSASPADAQHLRSSSLSRSLTVLLLSSRLSFAFPDGFLGPARRDLAVAYRVRFDPHRAPAPGKVRKAVGWRAPFPARPPVISATRSNGHRHRIMAAGWMADGR